MKQYQRLLALLLCTALLVCLCACTEKTAPAKPTDSTVATDTPDQESPALQLYEQARSAIDNAEDVSLRISTKKKTTVGGETFSETSEQTLTFNGIGTKHLRVYCDDQHVFGTAPVSMQEYYADNSVYLITDDVYKSGKDQHSVQASCTEEEFLSRHYPAVMLDAALYQNITITEGEKLTTLTMTEPTGAENWVLPGGAQFLSGSGLARINKDNALHSSEYHVKYQYGNSTIELDITAYISLEAEEIALPEKARSFPKFSSIESIYLQLRAVGYLSDAAKISATARDFYFSAADQYETDYVVTFHLNANEHMFRTRSETIYTDHTNGISENYAFEDYFMNKLYHIVEDEQDSLIGTVSWTEANYNSIQYIKRYILSTQLWDAVTVTDLGSTYLLEITYTPAIANSLAEAACNAIYGDPKIIENMAEELESGIITGYLAVDKFSGLPTASGIAYLGSYVAGRYAYPVMAQIDTMIDVPAMGVYKAIAEEMPNEATPEVPATPLFYHVTGDDGQEMWLLGTVHVGDERTAYLPQKIYDAFDSSDAAAFEFNIDAFEKQLETDEALQEIIAGYYYYEDGSQTATHLDRGTYNDAIKLLKASGNYSIYVDYLKPYFWSSMLDSFYLQQNCRLTSDQGVDMRLTDRALKQGKKILEVESAESQLAMFSGFSDELQELLLKQILEMDVIAGWEETNLMYDTWCAGDEAAMRKYLSTDPGTLAQMSAEERALYEEYNNAMTLDRNRAMLEVAKSYLESGETVFFAVGLAHLLVDEGLVDTLRDAGYTVELVTYSE